MATTPGAEEPDDRDPALAATEPEQRGAPAGREPSATAETRTGEPLEPAAPRGTSQALPRVRDDRYEILSEHGRGGIGCVYRAHDRELGRHVAIKKLISRDNVRDMRFFREAAITARLEHPGIVPIHEAGWWSDGTPFYAMKLIAGRPLRDLIAERPTVEQRLGLLHHVIAVADAIAYVHARKVIHRDLKPSNVIVGEFGETVVIDWGLAKDLTANDGDLDGGGPLPARRDDDLTSAGSVLGTPAYMAPEQRRGEAVDQRADVFAIGTMLWQLCSLESVPPADPSQRRAVLRRARIDDDLIAIIDKAIAGDPQDRYRDAGALVADLRAFTSGARIAARRYSPLAVVARWIRRHRLLAISAVTALALLALLVRTLLHAWMTERLADLSVTQAEVEAGRQALLHDDSGQAQRQLARAYLRGERSPGTAFMLARALQPRIAEQARFSSTAGRMWSAAFSPDGRRIVTSDDTSAQIWDADTHRRLFTLPHGSEVHHAMFAGDGARIVTAARGAVRVWETGTGALVRALMPPPGRGAPTDYYHVDRSPDGKLIAAIDADGAVADVWEAASGAVVAELRSDDAGYPSIAFTADGRWLVTGGGHGVRVFDTGTWVQAMALAGPSIHALDIDPTAPRLITGSADGDVAIWAIPSGDRIQHLRQLGDRIETVAFGPGGAMVASGALDGTVQVWDASSGKLLSTNHQLRSKIQSLEFDRTSKLVVAGGSTGKVLVEDSASGMPLAVLEGPGTIVWARFDPSAARVVGASWDGTARIWDAASPYLRWRSPAHGSCRSVTNLDPDRRFLPVSCDDHTTRVWDTVQDRLLAELTGTPMIDGELAPALPAVSAAGDRAAVARDHAAVIYELPGGRPLHTIRHGAAVSAVAFAASGHDLITGAIDGSVLVTRDGGEPVSLPGFAAGVDATGFLADGRPVAAAGRQLRIYDAARRTVLAELELATRVGTLRSSPDGHRLVSNGRWNDAPTPSVLWDVEHYRRIAPLVGHVGLVWSSRFVRDGREILTAGGDSTVRSWDAASGRLLHTYRGGTRFMADAELDPGGAMVVGAGGDGLLYFWDAANERPLWTLLAHQPHVVGVHFEGGDLVTRGYAGDVARWTLPKPDLDARPELLRELSQ